MLASRQGPHCYMLRFYHKRTFDARNFTLMQPMLRLLKALGYALQGRAVYRVVSTYCSRNRAKRQ